MPVLSLTCATNIHMGKKIESKELKYCFREHYLARCVKQCQRADFAAFYAEVAKAAGNQTSPRRIQRLVLAKRSELTAIADVNEICGFSMVLGIPMDQLTTEAVERVVVS